MSEKTLNAVPFFSFDGKFRWGWNNFNNGYAACGEEVERLTKVCPSERQAKFADLGYYTFIHYGMNTFTQREWGTGKEDPSEFCPDVIDTDQWARVIKSTGSAGIIFTAKHHDGFCLFPSAYTEHSIKNSPYQNGNGDVVKQLSESCKKYGLKFGIYLSPWDMHEKTYGTKAYDDYFVNQLTELCTNYGDIFVFWFDGAKGKEAPDFTYDFERYYKVIRELQPNAVISNCGPDIRWIGNEGGKVRKSEWCVVSYGTSANEHVMANSQQSEKGADELLKVDPRQEDLGSRKALENCDRLIWKQAEADISIHKGWFYSKKPKRRKADFLSDVYFKTVGANALLLMNVPPSKRGIIEKEDVKILEKFKKNIDSHFGCEVPFKAFADRNRRLDAESGFELRDDEHTVTLKTDKRQRLSALVLQENIRKSQRVEEFAVYKKCLNGYKRLEKYTVIGSKKIILLGGIKTDELKIVFIASRGRPIIRKIALY